MQIILLAYFWQLTQKWGLYNGYKGGNNLLRAAAQLLLDDMEQAG